MSEQEGNTEIVEGMGNVCCREHTVSRVGQRWEMESEKGYTKPGV